MLYRLDLDDGGMNRLRGYLAVVESSVDASRLGRMHKDLKEFVEVALELRKRMEEMGALPLGEEVERGSEKKHARNPR